MSASTAGRRNRRGVTDEAGAAGLGATRDRPCPLHRAVLIRTWMVVGTATEVSLLLNVPLISDSWSMLV